MQTLDLVRIALITIAFSMGMGLSFADFSRIFYQPKPVFVGLVGQVIILPIVALSIALFLNNTYIAIGVLLIGVCPGGSSSNYMTYLAKGDIALSITLTSISSLLSVLSVPIIFNGLSMIVFSHESNVYLPVYKTIESVFLYTVIPVLIGMACRQIFPNITRKSQKIVANSAFLLLLGLTPPLIIKYSDQLFSSPLELVFSVGLHIPITMASGYFISKFYRLSVFQSKSVVIEVGVQNVALAIYLSLSLLKDVRYTAPSIAYLILMYVFVPVFVWICRTEKYPILTMDRN